MEVVPASAHLSVRDCVMRRRVGGLPARRKRGRYPAQTWTAHLENYSSSGRSLNPRRLATQTAGSAAGAGDHALRDWPDAKLVNAVAIAVALAESRRAAVAALVPYS